MPTKEVINEFDPVLFSHEENAWLMENLGKPPVVALRDLKPGVNANAVRPLLTRVQELEQLKQHEQIPWVGVEAMKAAITVWLAQDAKWLNDTRRSVKAPRFPSLYSFDSKGRGHLGGPGSDSGRVRTFFDSKGSRRPFAIELLPDYQPEWVAPAFTEQATEGLFVNAALNRIECFCGHTENFKGDSRASERAARARMSKHLRKATEEVERHREVHTSEFGN